MYIIPLMILFYVVTFDLPVKPTSESIHTSPTVLLGPENVGVAVGIWLLSHIQTEKYVAAYVLPVNGGHF